MKGKLMTAQQSPTVKFIHDPITLGEFAVFSTTDIFSLVWYPGGNGGGPIKLGIRYFEVGGTVTRINDVRFNYAHSRADFKDKARAFLAASEIAEVR